MGVSLPCSSFFFFKDLGVSIGSRKTKMTRGGESQGQSFLPGPPNSKARTLSCHNHQLPPSFTNGKPETQ